MPGAPPSTAPAVPPHNGPVRASAGATQRRGGCWLLALCGTPTHCRRLPQLAGVVGITSISQVEKPRLGSTWPFALPSKWWV